MRVHSIVRLMTNSSSETFTFSSVLAAEDVQARIVELWTDFCLQADQEELLDYYEYLGISGLEAIIAHGPDITFRDLGMGTWEYFTSMDNNEPPEQFANYVVSHMNTTRANMAEAVCRVCMNNGRATCPPCWR